MKNYTGSVWVRCYLFPQPTSPLFTSYVLGVIILNAWCSDVRITKTFKMCVSSTCPMTVLSHYLSEFQFLYYSIGHNSNPENRSALVFYILEWIQWKVKGKTGTFTVCTFIDINNCVGVRDLSSRVSVNAAAFVAGPAWSLTPLSVLQ